MYVPGIDGSNVDVARVDTAHAGCHADRLYLPEGHAARLHDYSVTVFTIDGAVRELLGPWRHLDSWRAKVRAYDENHGLPPDRNSGFR